MLKKKMITETEFDELCQYVCSQLKSSSSKERDRETLYFAIYWQLCEIFEIPVAVVNKLNSKIEIFQELLLRTIEKRRNGEFDVLQIIEKNINYKSYAVVNQK